MTEYRVPFAFISEVHPQFGSDNSRHNKPDVEYEDVEIEVDKHGRERVVSRRKHHGNPHLPPALRLPMEDFPPEPIDIEVGLNQGPPVADRYFYQGIQSNELYPRDSQHPVMVPATRKSRYYKSHYYPKRPHWKYETEPFAAEGGFGGRGRSRHTFWKFLGHLALAIALIICFAMLQNAKA